ncbi:hypothetical protein LINPERHAP2_LOCUS23831 [Linum perenne]
MGSPDWLIPWILLGPNHVSSYQLTARNVENLKKGVCGM